MKSKNSQLINDCYATVILPSNKLVVIKINQSLLDKTPSQQESLLQPHQARAFGFVIDANQQIAKECRHGGFEVRLHE